VDLLQNIIGMLGAKDFTDRNLLPDYSVTR